MTHLGEQHLSVREVNYVQGLLKYLDHALGDAPIDAEVHLTDCNGERVGVIKRLPIQPGQTAESDPGTYGFYFLVEDPA